MDEWGNFPKERQRLLKLAKEAGNAILLSGNVHFAEVSRDEEAGLTELTSSGMTHINEAYGKASNKYRVGEAFVDLNFGLVEIDWEAQTLSLSAVGLDGHRRIREVLDMPWLRK
jgi:alkaline phosphatase D